MGLSIVQRIIAGFVLIGIGAIAGGAALMWALRAAR